MLRLAVCLMVGIVVGDRVSAAWPWLVFFAVAVGAALLSGRHAVVQSCAIAVSMVLLGILLMVRDRAALAVSWPDGEVVCEAVVVSEPIEKPKTMAVDILLAQGGRKLKCYLHKDERSRRLRIGDGLRIRSRIEPNREWRRGTFSYRRFLEVHGFTGQTYVAGWNWAKARVSLHGLSYLQRTELLCLRYRSRLLKRLSAHGLKDDQYAVVAAMALGDRSALTRELREAYAVSGASHVLALSGLHLGIIYSLLSLLVVGRRWRVVSRLLLVVSIWAFVFLVGLPASVVRAAVMLTAYALLSLGHRSRMSVNTLSFAAMAMLVVNPLSLYDVGFQMSFMAVLAILVLVPIADAVLPPDLLMRHRLLRWLWTMAAISCAAQAGTAPLIAYYFGRFTPYFLLTNLVVIPAATLILYLSLAVLLVPQVAYLLIYIVGRLNAVLLYIAALPGASIGGLRPSAVQVAMAYVVMLAAARLVSLLHVAKPA